MRDGHARQLRDDLKAWHTAWLFSVERTIRLVRLEAQLKDTDGFLEPHSRVPTHFTRESLGQTSIWPASSVGQVFFHPDVYAWTVDLLGAEADRAVELRVQARALLQRCVEAAVFPNQGEFGFATVALLESSRRHDGDLWGPGLAGAIEEYQPFVPEYGACLRCAVVRPVRSLHVLRSPTIPIPIYVCARGEPPPDRLRPSVDDHWGSPCSCAQCQDSLSATGAAQLLFALPVGEEQMQSRNRDGDLWALLRGASRTWFAPVQPERADPELRN